MTTDRRGGRIVTAILLGAAAVAFTAGTAAERSSHHESPAEHATATPTPTATPVVSLAPALSAPEGSARREAAERGESLTTAPPSAAGNAATSPSIAATPTPATPGTTAPEGSAEREATERASAAEAGEQVFGINTESVALVSLADLASVALLVLVLVSPSGLALRTVAALTVAFSAAATALDVHEALHQHDLGHTGLLSAAVGVATLHLLCALAAGALIARRPSLVRGGAG